MPSYIPAHPLLLVPLNCTPDPVLFSPVPAPIPPVPHPSWVHSEAGGVRVRPRSPVLLELLPHPQTHTHTQKTTALGKPECSTKCSLPSVCPDAYSSLGPRPRPLPRSRGLPPPASPAHKASPLVCVPQQRRL